ncbi:G-D-S-L family lipolytic protein [Olleya sp. YSTF-M6]|uniref:G-D-S-L family lipolytic protein n=1 Tax=Olleya sediminilitoris TaxID=2795739 RepID=A0ABS1WGM2_9FLAO|nr:G-D-S-L family lipolytic protein [Olleya sediminilitoris]MBL7558260.1 G-D-S-L family lipolytic protein [Olleya sediminilitoris]
MKTFKNIKYIGLLAVAISFTACSDEEDFEELLDQPPTQEANLPALTSGSADFSTFVSLGASFTAGFTDGALFIAAQENSFPNTLSNKFAMTNGGAFNQPLMEDNIGGLLLGGNVVANPRLFFNGTGPEVLPATPTTDVGNSLAADGSIFENVGVPGAKSTHIGLNGYASLNPYFGRFANSPTISMLEYAIAQNPTFFTLSEIGGNDVLGYATSGGESDTTSDNYDPITPTTTFDFVFNDMVNQLTAVTPNGVVTNVPYITDLPHFTTVPHNPLDPTNPDFGPQIPLLNSIFSALNPIFEAVDPARAIVFSTTEASPVVIKDETLDDISAIISAQLNASPTFPAFIAQFGLPAQAAPLVANLLGATYGQTRQATPADLLVLPSSSIIGTVNEANVGALMGQGLPQALAGQFSVEGVSLPLEDKWVLLPSEQDEIQIATDAYNATIANVANTKGLALVDLNGILSQASSTGIMFDDYNLTTNLVTGGLVSLDGIHLTARGYALMANKFLEAIDLTYGSNFIASGNVAKAEDFGVTYSPTLQ